MAKQTIGVGSAANDGTGDPIRTAFTKVNDNFNEVYSTYEMTGKLSIGNSTVNSSISNTDGFRTGNSTFITIANSTVVQISNSSGIANLTATSLKMGANVTVGLSSILVGNTTVNSISNSSTIQLVNSTTTATLTSSALAVGNSTINALASSSLFQVANSTATANLTATSLAVGLSTLSTSGLAVGSNVAVNASSISIGNASINVVISSTGITGNVSLGNVIITGNLTVNGTVTTVNTATLDIADLDITIAKNATTPALANGAGILIEGATANLLYISDSNTFNFSHYVKIGNASVNSTVNSTNFTGTANNALYLGGVLAANYVANLGLIANSTGTHVKANNGITANSSGTFVTQGDGLLVNSTGVHAVGNNGIVSNTNGLFVNANNGITANSTGTFVTEGTGVVVNSIGVHVNSSYIATLDANNAAYLGGTAAADYQTEAGLAGNVATLTSNNATYAFGKSEIDLNVNNALTANSSSYLGAVAAASYVQNTDSRTLSGNLYFTGANNVFDANTVKIGTSTIAANGYTYLPNGLKMNWGKVSANSSDGNIVFTSAFSTAVYSVTVSGTNTEITTIPAVTVANTTEARVRTSNTNSVDVYFTAIGS